MIDTLRRRRRSTGFLPRAVRGFAQRHAGYSDPVQKMVLSWPAEVDLSNAREQTAEFEAYLDRAEAGDVLVLDLAATRFIDSTGLGVLIAARAGAERRGVELVLEAAGVPVVRLLDLTGLRQLFCLREVA